MSATRSPARLILRRRLLGVLVGEWLVRDSLRFGSPCMSISSREGGTPNTRLILRNLVGVLPVLLLSEYSNFATIFQDLTSKPNGKYILTFMCSS